jgi:hypothetical protein
MVKEASDDQIWKPQTLINAVVVMRCRKVLVPVSKLLKFALLQCL